LDNPFVGCDAAEHFSDADRQSGRGVHDVRAVSQLNYDMKTPHVDMWNITVERQFSTSWVVSAGYVGSHTSNILERTPLNTPIAGATGGRCQRIFFRVAPASRSY